MENKINIQVPVSIEDKKILDYVITEKLGLSINNAVIMFLKKLIAEKGLPFDVACPLPNEETLEAMWESEHLNEDEALSFNSKEELIEYFNTIIKESED